ncbi:MAG: FAD-dependent oxidoreductase [Eubacteriales bacterium]
MKVVIVGGVAGGATAAARLRRLDEHAEIIIFEKSGFVSYANCGLPYFIGGVIQEEEALTLQTPDNFKRRFLIDVKVRHQVIKIHKEKKEVSVLNLETGEVFQETYDKLILSPGAKPTLPPLEGKDLQEVFTLRTVEDTLKIHQYVKENQPKSVVIAGGGFIGVEVAENLCELGLDVTIVQSQPQLMAPLDGEMAAFLHAKMRSHGIKLVFGKYVTGIQKAENGIEAVLQGGALIQADMVILAIGVTPDTELAKEAGLELGLRGSIIVNDKMETSENDIYGVGDAVQVKHYITGEDALISLAGPANKQGRIVADNICGLNSRYKGSQGSSVLKLFDMTMATTGINEKTAKSLGLQYDKIYLSPGSHAGYYQGSTVMTMKVIFDKNNFKILGAQIVGYDGVDKRIDVLATAMHMNMSALQLKDLDLAYAPPYSSAKDPVNMAGFMIENIANCTLKQFFIEDVADLPRDGSVTLLDTRTRGEYASGHFEGFFNIPVDDLREQIHTLDSSKPIYVNCQSGLRSYIACRILMQYGFNAYNFSGGYRLYATVKADQLASKTSQPCGKE